MNKAEILTVLKELHNVTGFRVSLHDADYREIAAYPEKSLPFCRAVHTRADELVKCAECDRFASERAVALKKSARLVRIFDTYQIPIFCSEP